jgi:hypothetical protein
MSPSKEITITILSDTHGLEHELDVPPSNILLHCGDWTTQTASAEPTRRFNRWLGTLPHPHKVITCGNHEWVLEDPSNRSLVTNASLLVNRASRLWVLRFGHPQ